MTATICFAQNTDGLYLFKDRNDPVTVYNVIAVKAKVAPAQLAKLRDLLHNSAEVQLKYFKNPENNTPDKTKAMEVKQTILIEKSLQGIFGPDRYNYYLKKKPEIIEEVKKVEIH